MPRKKYGVQVTEGQETSRWQTNVQDGQGGGQEVTDILLDASARTMVRRNLVAMEKVIVGKVATISCAHGDTKLHPLAKVEVELDGAHIQVEAALSEELPVSVMFPS